MNAFVLLSACTIVLASSAPPSDSLIASIGKLITLPIDVGVEAAKRVTNTVQTSSNVSAEASPRPRVKRQTSKCCANGWTAYEESCYYFERHLAANFTQAVSQCAELDAKLWVPNTIEEFEAIRLHAQSVPYVSWLGGQGALNEEDTLVYEWEDGSDVADVDSFPWTFNLAPNNLFTSVNTCVGYMHSQLAQVKIAGIVQLPAKGLVWTNCAFGVGRFAICEKSK